MLGIALLGIWQTETFQMHNGDVDDRSLVSARLQAGKEAFNRAKQHGKKGEYDLAIRAYTEAIEYRPNYAIAYTFRGLTYSHLGEYAKSIADLDKLVELEPIAENFRARADVFAKAGEYDNAISDYSKIIQLGEADSGLYNNRSNTYRAKKEYELALDDLNIAIELSPDNPTAYYNRAVLFFEQGDMTKSLHNANMCLQVASEISNNLLGRINSLQPGEGFAIESLDTDTSRCLLLATDIESKNGR